MDIAVWHVTRGVECAVFNVWRWVCVVWCLVRGVGFAVCGAVYCV